MASNSDIKQLHRDIESLIQRCKKLNKHKELNTAISNLKEAMIELNKSIKRLYELKIKLQS